ncbi:AAA family ATPase [Nostoc sp. TCL26-01]|uniref:AAA family ATPase n=1 Tax=Nostoc sp. TCL26-01 TaxID=2576904 RepID=UPI0015BF8C1B|nr:AAA family ATPase [Nostoc sp. TCL26-01]QLE59100.1 excinuclease [Nostoc sp. TCL26-01]
MQIQQISVSGLFGIFDHVIPLNMNERITIIHGPNGFGKTVILRMLNGFFNSRYSVFRTIPFSRFRVVFDNDCSVEVVKNSDNLEKKDDITFYFYEPNSEKEYFSLKGTKNPPDIDFPFDVLDDIIPELRRIGSKLWHYLPTGENLSLNEVIDRFEDILPSKAKSREEPEWLEKLKNDIHVRLIESQRLLNFVANRSPRLYSGTRSMLPTVSAYSSELAQEIQSKLAEYGTTSQSLDRTFPARVVQKQPSSDLTGEQLRHQLDELEETRSRLIEVGLLDKDENSDFQIQSQFIDESTKNILSVYVEDVEKKLSVFSEIASKIELLRRIINNKFAYSYKEMNFNKEKGFVFKTLYHPSSSNRDTLSPIDLSSGEQHELVLLYELLFKVQPNSLVLIDEPELSLHVGWQVQFLKDLQEITKLADLDILMATHSPDIIQDRWDLTVELKGPVK